MIVLFQGDSITDMGRGRTSDPNHLLGHGYAFIIAAQEATDFPESGIKFINQGISGNTIDDLSKRWDDTLSVKPDVLSILIGINDIRRKLKAKETFDAHLFKEKYDGLLMKTVKALPEVNLVLGEPFIGTGDETSGDSWKIAMQEVREVIDNLGVKYNAPIVHYQNMFDRVALNAPPNHWIWDGIHPTYSGHQLMAKEWMQTYRAYYAISEQHSKICDQK